MSSAARVKLTRSAAVVAFIGTQLLAGGQQDHGEYLAGYLIIPTGERVPKRYNAGFSMYVAAWPLVKSYPGHRFQTGLPGTWMFAQYDGPAPKDMYSDVEGGLGWWTDTRFPTATPKFIMGGVGPNFSEIANGPAHGAGSWDEPRGLYGVAQLSPWLLFPIDGLNLAQGTRGQLFGYGYLNLPLLKTSPESPTQSNPAGRNCWTLFLNSANFKGPVAFFTPYFWSHCAAKDPRLLDQLLDSRPVEPNTAIQMETQYIRCKVVKADDGESYARIDPTSFPNNASGSSALVHQSTSYDSTALYDSVAAWFGGGRASNGSIDPGGAYVRSFKPGYATWEIRQPAAGGTERKIPLAWSDFATPSPLDPHTYGYRWNPTATKLTAGLATIPEYYKLAASSDPKKAKWIPVDPALVPDTTGLKTIVWSTPVEPAEAPYTTPEGKQSSWRRPGPVAGPFKAHVGDGTIVTYYWYRFADQPALLNAGLTLREREALQKRVEMLHRSWTKDRDYLPKPRIGQLAKIDAALVVRPPKGLEIGYVPIATRQEKARK